MRRWHVYIYLRFFRRLDRVSHLHIEFDSPSPHEQPHPRHYQSHLEVLLQGILLPHESPHEHDRHRLAALGQNLYGENDVPQRPHAEEGAPHARESQNSELCGGDGARLLCPRVSPDTGSDSV